MMPGSSGSGGGGGGKSGRAFQFRDLDMYTKVNSDLTGESKPTGTSTSLSIIGWIFIAVLLLSEFYGYISPNVTEHMVNIKFTTKTNMHFIY